MDLIAWDSVSSYPRRRASQRIAQRHRFPPLSHDALCSAIIKDHPMTGPEPTAEAVADAIIKALDSSTQRGEGKARAHAILASVRYKNFDVINDLVKSKNKKRVEKLSDPMLNMSPEVITHVSALKSLQEKHDMLEEKMSNEIQEIEAKYQTSNNDLMLKKKLLEVEAVEAKYRLDFEPLYDQRRGIVADNRVPKFWLRAMLYSNTGLTEAVTTQDTMVLMYLNDIRCVKVDNPRGVKFEFSFSPNPYFKNPVLTKVYHHSIHGGQIVVDGATGTDIHWYPRRRLTHTVVKKRKLGVCDKCECFETQKFGYKSFFNFFSKEWPGYKDKEKQAEHLRQDCYIGGVLQKKIIPHAVTAFLDRSPFVAKAAELQELGY